MIEILRQIFEKALNQYVQLDPETVDKLERFEGKIVKVVCRGFPIDFILQIQKDEIMVLDDEFVEVDTTITGTPLTLLQLGLSSGVDKAKHLFSGEVEIAGDIELGQALQQVFENMEIDWEDKLSCLTGDIVAHQVGQFVRHANVWGERAVNNTQKNVTEYLQQEIKLLPPREELQDFFRDVDVIRDDVERMQARINYLTQKEQD